MDADHFDAITRAVGGSRRRLVVNLSGLALGALAPLLGLADAEAGKKKDKKKRKRKRDRFDDIFDPDGCGYFASLCGGQCCNWGVGQSCCNGQVCCPSGKKCCGSRCCDYCSPEGICGICPPCTPPDTCINGYCKSCPEGEGYTICIQPNGVPTCCHTNPSSGTPMKCEGGYCVSGDD